MNDFVDQLELELVAAARKRSRRRRRLPMTSRRGLRAIPVLAAALVPVVIAIGAFALLGNRTPGPVSPAAHSYPAAVQRVVDAYAVFRRPQNQADRVLSPRLVPQHAIASLTRFLTTVDGRSVFVSLVLRGTSVTGRFISTQGVGAGVGTFTPYPLARAQPPMDLIAHETVALVPDAATRAVWTSYSQATVVTRPHANVLRGPSFATHGLSLYAGTRQIAQIFVPDARFPLTTPDQNSRTTAHAYISTTNGQRSVQIVAHHVAGAHEGKVYGIWLYSTLEHERFLGMNAEGALRPAGDVIGDARLPLDYRGYRELLVTSENTDRPRTPGTIVLSGQLP